MQHEKWNSAPGSRVGTPAYLAPEVILTTKGKTYNAKVGTVTPCRPLLRHFCRLACCCAFVGFVTQSCRQVPAVQKFPAEW